MSPAGQVSTCALKGSFKEPAKIQLLAQQLKKNENNGKVKSVMTVEIEHVNCDAMDAIQKSENIAIYPSPATVRLIQDKYLQKST